MTARKPISRQADMASDRVQERDPNANAPMQTIGPWVPPPESDRAIVKAGLERNGAFDLAEILGLREAA